MKQLSPDFTDLASAFDALITAYGFGEALPATFEEKESFATELLTLFPTLLVLDDIDSLDVENENVSYWFIHTLPKVSPKSKVVLTSRRALHPYGSFTSKINGLNYDETKRFLRNISEQHFGNPDVLGSGALPKLIRDATDGSPLYLEDLARLILIVGKQPNEVVADWKNCRHDAREYALRREFEILTRASQEVLLVAALAGDPISRAELLAVLGGSESSLEASIAELQQYFLISPPDVASLTPTFEINRNLGILVKHVMATDPNVRRIANALKQVRNKTGKPHRVAKDASLAIRDAVALVAQAKHSAAEALLREFLVPYPDEGALLSHLGWVLSRWPTGGRITEAQSMMQRAVDVRHRNKATYENIGNLYLGSRQFEKARLALEVGLEMFAENANLRFMHATAVAERALEISAQVDLLSPSGAQVVIDPLRDALRTVIAATKVLKSDSDEVYVAHREELFGLDKRLRVALDGARRGL